jgi:hypothetical protein
VLTTEPFITHEFFDALSTPVWDRFIPEIAAL